MNTSSFTCSRERTVFNALHATPRVADVLFASPLTRLFGVGRTSKVRPFFANQRGPLFCFGFFGRNRFEPRLTQFGFGFVSPFVFTGSSKNIGVPFPQMLSLRNALKIFQSVVGLVTVNVMNLFGRIKIIHPTFSNSTVNERFAHDQITAGMRNWRIWTVLSENFPAARNGVKMVKGAVFHAIYYKANHAVPSVVTNVITPYPL